MEFGNPERVRLCECQHIYNLLTFQIETLEIACNPEVERKK